MKILITAYLIASLIASGACYTGAMNTTERNGLLIVSADYFPELDRYSVYALSPFCNWCDIFLFGINYERGKIWTFSDGLDFFGEWDITQNWQTQSRPANAGLMRRFGCKPERGAIKNRRKKTMKKIILHEDAEVNRVFYDLPDTFSCKFIRETCGDPLTDENYNGDEEEFAAILALIEADAGEICEDDDFLYIDKLEQAWFG